MTKLHQPKISLGILAAAYLISLVAMLLSGPATNIAMACVGIQVVIPYLIPFAWVGGIESRSKYFDPIWIKVTLLLATSIYVALSVSWGASILNEAFSLPASNFPIALAIISLAYFPIGLLGPILSIIILLLSASASFIFLWAFITSSGLKQVIKRIAIIFAAVLYLGFVLGSTMFLHKNSLFLTQLIAINTDFDEFNRCSNLASIPDIKVAHIGEGNVLVFKGRNSRELNLRKGFELKKCQTLADI